MDNVREVEADEMIVLGEDMLDKISGGAGTGTGAGDVVPARGPDRVAPGA